MTDLPESPLRLRLRVALKLMMALAGITVVTITLRYAGGGGDQATPERSRVDVSAMEPDTVRTLGWDSRPVIVLRRGRETIDRLGTRLRNDPSPGWFVAFANGTARGCSVVWEAESRRFRESCGQAAWDAAGEPLAGTQAPPLNVPPHRFSGEGQLLLGADAPQGPSG
jgi:Rieske Fe-S protein